MDDIHKSGDRIRQAKDRIRRRFSEDNAEAACGFLTRLKLENKSPGRIANYADNCIRILRICDSPIRGWSRADIERIHEAITDSPHANSVKKGTLSTLKRLYHFAAHGTIPDKNRGGEYDPLVSWITPGAFRDRYEKITPADLLTGQETLELIRAVKGLGGRYVRRNVAAVFAMLEGAYRPGELFNIRLGGIDFHDDFVRVSTTGKTGPKSLALVASYAPLREWLTDHPQADDPGAYLLYEDNGDGLMRYQAFLDMLRRARRGAGIKKRVWPYLFRHTALTEYSKRLGNIVKVYGNWSARSNALSVYEHLASSDQEEAALSMHGIKGSGRDDFALLSKLCPHCKRRNTPDRSRCTGCSAVLADRLVQSRQSDTRAQKAEAARAAERRFASKIADLERLVAVQQRQIDEGNRMIRKMLSSGARSRRA